MYKRQSEALCAEEKFTVAGSSGYTYILGGEENIYAAIKAGRVFGCVDYIHDCLLYTSRCV